MVDELGWWSSSSPCSALHIEVTEHHLDARDHLEDYLVTRRVHIVHLHVRCGVSEQSVSTDVCTTTTCMYNVQSCISRPPYNTASQLSITHVVHFFLLVCAKGGCGTYFIVSHSTDGKHDTQSNASKSYGLELSAY